MIWLMSIHVILAVYLLFYRFPKPSTPKHAIEIKKVSVVIPARNEAQNIGLLLGDIIDQGFHEIVVVDDASDDDTAMLAERAGVTVLRVDGGKKHALSEGIKAASGEYIQQFDADVRIPSGYFDRLQGRLSSARDMYVMPIRYVNDAGFIGQIVLAEHAALTGIAILLDGWSAPVLANGASLVYRRSAFNLVNGFGGNEHRMSGDDIFLLEKFNAYKLSVERVLDARSVVDVRPTGTIGEFVAQRLRWAGKMRSVWSARGLAVGALALVILVLPWFCILSMRHVDYIIWAWVGLALLLWYGSHIHLVRMTSRGIAQSFSPFHTLIASIFFSLYAPALAILSIFVRPTWKGRRTY